MVVRCMAVAWLSLAAAFLPAADDPYAAFPAETGVVMRIASPSNLATKTRAFLNKAAPQYAILGDQLVPALGSLMGNPLLSGVDAKSDWYVAIVPRREGRPAVVYAVRAADADALQKDVGPSYAFSRFEEWVLYSLDKQAMAAVQSSLEGKSESVAPALAGPHSEPLRDGDFAMYFHVPVLREAYRTQIDAVRQRFTGAAGGRKAAADAKSREWLADLAIDTLDDAVALAGHVSIAEDALDFHGTLTVQEDSASAKRLAEMKPSDGMLLAKLPPGKAVYFAMTGATIQVLKSASEQAKPAGDDVVTKLLQKFDFHGIAAAGDAGGPGTSSVTLLVDVDDAARLRSEYRSLATADRPASKDSDAVTIEIRPEAETIDGVKVDAVTVTTTPGAKDNDAGVFGSLLAGNDATQRIAVVDGLYVHTSGEGAMGETIKSIRGEPGGDAPAKAAFEATLASLDADPLALLLFDMPMVLRSGLRRGAAGNGELPLDVDTAAIENLELAPSFTGVTVVTEPQEARVNGVLPAAQVRGLIELLQVLQQAAPKRDAAE